MFYFLFLILSFPGARMSFQTTDSEIDLKNIDDQEENPTISRLNSIRAKGRWSSLTPTENESDVQTLTFKHTTKAQDRTRKRQQPVKLEPLVSLKKHTHTAFWALFSYKWSCKIALEDELTKNK
jgi:hypothetical protein